MKRKLNKRGETLIGVAIASALLIAFGGIMHDQGKWGIKDGFKGSEYVDRCDNNPDVKNSNCWYEDPKYASWKGLNVVRDIKPSKSY